MPCMLRALLWAVLYGLVKAVPVWRLFGVRMRGYPSSHKSWWSDRVQIMGTHVLSAVQVAIVCCKACLTDYDTTCDQAE